MESNNFKVIEAKHALEGVLGIRDWFWVILFNKGREPLSCQLVLFVHGLLIPNVCEVFCYVVAAELFRTLQLSLSFWVLGTVY